MRGFDLLGVDMPSIAPTLTLDPMFASASSDTAPAPSLVPALTLDPTLSSSLPPLVAAPTTSSSTASTQSLYSQYTPPAPLQKPSTSQKPSSVASSLQSLLSSSHPTSPRPQTTHAGQQNWFVRPVLGGIPGGGVLAIGAGALTIIALLVKKFLSSKAAG